MNIYVASSWRNPYQPGVVARLREAGHEVYDFRDHGFPWRDLDPNWEAWTASQFKAALQHHVAQRAFATDKAALERADCLVLVYPCGNDAHWEAGLVKGAGKLVIILMIDPPKPPGLMDLLADALFTDPEDLVGWLAITQAAESTRSGERPCRHPRGPL